MFSDHPMQIHVHLPSAMLDFGMSVQRAIVAPHCYNRRLAIGGVPGQQGEVSGRVDVDEYREKTVVEAVFLANRLPETYECRSIHRVIVLLFMDPGKMEWGMSRPLSSIPRRIYFEGAANPCCPALDR